MFVQSRPTTYAYAILSISLEYNCYSNYRPNYFARLFLCMLCSEYDLLTDYKRLLKEFNNA